MHLTREDKILAALAPAGTGLHTPVQVQKLLFLLEDNIPESMGGRHFHFEPYHYGPFDKTVYSALEVLSRMGLVDIEYGSGNWRNYRLTPEGQARGQEILQRLEPSAVEYIKKISDFVRKLSFSQLVSAVYKAYPEMRARSVFQD